MNVQKKTLLILVTTLGVGFLAGATVAGFLFRQRIEYIQSFGSPSGFVAGYKNFLGPLSDEQDDVITPLLEQTGQDFDTLLADTSQDFVAMINDLDKQLALHLTEEQYAAFYERRAQAKKRYAERYSLAGSPRARDKE